MIFDKESMVCESGSWHVNLIANRKEVCTIADTDLFIVICFSTLPV